MSDVSSQAARSIALFIKGEPAPWQVWTRQGPPPPGVLAFQAYQTRIQVEIKRRWDQEPITGPIELEIIFYRGIPASCPKGPAARQRWIAKHRMMRPDLTNYVKAAEDAIKGPGLIILDDSQVVYLTAHKGYAAVEGYTTIRVSTV